MNNDLYNNHSSESSNMYIANKRYPHLNKYIKRSYIKDKHKAMLDTKSKGNKTIFFDSDNELRPSNQKDLLISKAISKYPTNYAPGPNPYNDGIIQGYYVNAPEDPRYIRRNQYQYPLREIDDDNDDQMNSDCYERNIENGGEDIEDDEGNEGDFEGEGDIDVENGKEYLEVSPQSAANYYNDYVGDGIVRNNIPNYSPDSNGQNVRYYKKKKLNLYSNNNFNNYEQENENENDDEQYIIESPQDNYNMNRQPYRKRRVLGNLGDSASSEAYANNINQNNQSPENYSRIYIKPKTRYNRNMNNANNNNGISTEERGIESQRESPNNDLKNGSYLRKPPYHYEESDENDTNKYNKLNNYDEDSINVVEPPLYNHPLNEEKKGGKVDLNNYALLKNRGKKEEYNDDEERDDLDDDYEINEEKIIYIIKLQRKVKSHIKTRENKITKIQSIWRGRSTRKIMKLYHDLEEFIFLISMVNFNHFSDNFFFFINQLFNVYKAKTLKNQIDSPEEEKEDDQNENENEEEEDEKKDDNEKGKKNYDKLLNDYNNLQEKYNDLINNRNNISSHKKNINNDIISVPGETTIGTIKTDTRKFPKFRPQNNSISIINNENITFSNDNDENRDYDKHFYTPNQEDEDSFNDGSKDKRFSYSSIHSEENSKYFDNEQPGKGTTSGKRIILKTKGFKNPKIGLLSLNKKKERGLSYSPSSRGNSANKNIQNDSQIETRINNISIVPKHEDEFEIAPVGKEFDIIDPKQIEENIYDKYASNFGKDLRIVKNNKINIKNPNGKKPYCFDNDKIFPENENNLELVAPKKTDEQKINDILDNERLLEQMKKKIKPAKKKLEQHYGDSISLKNDKNLDDLTENVKKVENEIEQNINNLEILQNGQKNFDPSKLDLDSNELFLGEEKNMLKKKKLNKIVPRFEYSINIKKIKKLKREPNSFSQEKKLPIFDTEINNSFTIKNKSPKTEDKQLGFPKNKMMIDSVYNSEFSLIESQPQPVTGQKPTETEKKLVYLPFSDNAFKRLRRSKRTKDTYFTIEGEPLENKDLSKTNENNFIIKSEYIYIETNDEHPIIIEKPVKETIIIEKPNEDAKRFNDDKVKLSNEDNFDIKADKNKNKYLEDIEKNELTIPSEISHKKKIANKWADLNPIANEEFSLGNFYEYENENEEEQEDQIPEEQNENNASLDININEQFEVIDDKKEKQKNYVQSKENDIKLRGHPAKKEEKDSQADIRPGKSTIQTIINKNIFVNNENVAENAFSIHGTKPKEEKKEIPLMKDSNCQLNINRKRKSVKDNEATADLKPIKEFDNIEHMNNDDFAIKSAKKQKNEAGTEITAELKEIQRKEIPLENIKNEDINIKGEKKQTKETETTVDNDLNKIEPSNKNELMYSPDKKKVDNIISKADNLDIFAPEKEKIFEPSKIENINLESRNKSFPVLDINNCFNQTINGKVKEKPVIVKKVSFTFKPIKKDNKYLIDTNELLIKSGPKKKEKKSFNILDRDKSEEYNVMGKQQNKDKKSKRKKIKESETQTEDDLNNLIPDNNDNIIFEPSLNKRKENDMDERDQFIIEGLDKNIRLEMEYLDDVIIEQNKKKPFSNLDFDKCHDEIFKGKEKILLKLINNEPIVLSGKERDDLLELIQNEPIAFDGKEKEDMLKYIKNESIIIEGKEKPNLHFINNEPIELKGEDKNKNLDTINNEPIILDGENIKIKSKKKKMKDAETTTDKDINNNLVHNDNDQFTYDAVKPEKKDNKDLQLEKQKSLNIKQEPLNKEFDKDALELFHPENVEVIPEEKRPENANKNNSIDFVDNIEIKGESNSDDKNLEKTKNNIVKVYKAMKLKNALTKSIKNKKDFIDKLKDLENDDKNKFSCTSNDQIELLGDKNEKQYLQLDKQPQEQFTIKNKKKKLNEISTQITDELNNINKIQKDEFSLVGIDKENKEKDNNESEEKINKESELISDKDKENKDQEKPKKKRKIRKSKKKRI